MEAVWSNTYFLKYNLFRSLMILWVIPRKFFVFYYWPDEKRNFLHIFFSITFTIQCHNLINQVDRPNEEMLNMTRFQLFTNKEQKVSQIYFKTARAFIIPETWRLGFQEPVEHCQHVIQFQIRWNCLFDPFLEYQFQTNVAVSCTYGKHLCKL